MATFSARVTASTDDGYFAGSWDNSSSTIRLGRAFLGNAVKLGVRILNVTIPPGSTINSATLLMRAQNTDGDTVLSKVYGIDEDNTSTFSSDPTGRPLTSANTDWDFSGTTANNDYTSPGIAAIVQEIIDRAGWASGNAMGFILDDDGSSNDKVLDFKSYDGDSSNAPLLTIDYTFAGTTTSTTTTTTSTSTSTTTTTPTTFDFVPDKYRSWGLKYSLPGFSALGNIIPDQLGFVSRYNTLKIAKSALVSTSCTTLAFTTLTIDHNLGYRPAFNAYFRDFVTGEVYQVMSGFEDINFNRVGTYFSVHAKSDNATLVFKIYNNDSSNHNIDIFYEIFHADLTTEPTQQFVG